VKDLNLVNPTFSIKCLPLIFNYWNSKNPERNYILKKKLGKQYWFNLFRDYNINYSVDTDDRGLDEVKNVVLSIGGIYASIFSVYVDRFLQSRKQLFAKVGSFFKQIKNPSDVSVLLVGENLIACKDSALLSEYSEFVFSTTRINNVIRHLIKKQYIDYVKGKNFWTLSEIETSCHLTKLFMRYLP